MAGTAPAELDEMWGAIWGRRCGWLKIQCAQKVSRGDWRREESRSNPLRSKAIVELCKKGNSVVLTDLPASVLTEKSLRSYRSEAFELSNDPLFVGKGRDTVGLYMDPPERALVPCGRDIPDPGAGPHPAAIADAV